MGVSAIPRIPKSQLKVWPFVLFLISGIVILHPAVPFLPEFVPKQLDQQLDPALSSHPGGIPGFEVLKNVWYRNKTFYLSFEPRTKRRLPSKDQVLSGDVGYEILPIEQLEEMIFENASSVPVHSYTGTSLFLNDYGNGGWVSLAFFYHVTAEVLLGAFASLAATYRSQVCPPATHQKQLLLPGRNSKPQLQSCAMVDRVVIPWETQWRDGPGGYGVPPVVMEGIFGNDMIEAEEWRKYEGLKEEPWVHFDQVIIIDRWASHRHYPGANEWNKMALPMLTQRLPEHFFEPVRERMVESVGVPHHPPTRIGEASVNKTPKVVYINRQASNRKLEDNAHVSLLEVLGRVESDGLMTVVEAKLEDMPKMEQVAIFADADIIIAVHGNGMTHSMWMPTGGTVIEIFPPNSFLRDYEVVCESLSHRHFAIWNDRIVPKHEWETFKGELNAEFIHNGTLIPLDSNFIQGLLMRVANELALAYDDI